MTGGPWLEEDLCAVCPGQVLAPGRFDVEPKPSQSSRFDPAVGHRVNAAGAAVCVHPYRVGLPPGRYGSHRDPVPPVRLGDAAALVPPHEALEPPEHIDDMEAWLVATFRLAGPSRLAAALARAEATALERFPEGAVVAALRRVLSRELARVSPRASLRTSRPRPT
jgi:hypothetical protein